MGDAERIAFFTEQAGSEWSPWHHRTRFVSTLIADAAVVVDVGAGSQDLRKLIEDRCTYIGSELIDVPGLVQWDCSASQPPEELRGANYVVAAGVLEYLADPVVALRHMRLCARWGIFTYAVAEKRTDQHEGLWQNCMDALQLWEAIESAGWLVAEAHAWRDQVVLECRALR